METESHNGCRAELPVHCLLWGSGRTFRVWNEGRPWFDQHPEAPSHSTNNSHHVGSLVLSQTSSAAPAVQGTHLTVYGAISQDAAPRLHPNDGHAKWRDNSEGLREEAVAEDRDEEWLLRARLVLRQTRGCCLGGKLCRPVSLGERNSHL